MSGPIIRVGANPEFSEGWDRIFGGEDSKTTTKKTKKKSPAKKTSAKKTPAKKKTP